MYTKLHFQCETIVFAHFEFYYFIAVEITATDVGIHVESTEHRMNLGLIPCETLNAGLIECFAINCNKIDRMSFVYVS